MKKYTAWRKYEQEKDFNSIIGYVIFCVGLSIFIFGLFMSCGFQQAYAEENYRYGCERGPVDCTKAVIHHTDSGDVGVEEIDRWHKERGWDGIGYHFVIRTDGSIERGRRLSKTGAHAKGRNDRIGIALTGRNTFTVAQTESLSRLLRDLGVKEIERHHEKCPGPGLKFKGLK